MPVFPYISLKHATWQVRYVSWTIYLSNRRFFLLLGCVAVVVRNMQALPQWMLRLLLLFPPSCLCLLAIRLTNDIRKLILSNSMFFLIFFFPMQLSCNRTATFTFHTSHNPINPHVCTQMCSNDSLIGPLNVPQSQDPPHDLPLPMHKVGTCYTYST